MPEEKRAAGAGARDANQRRTGFARLYPASTAHCFQSVLIREGGEYNRGLQHALTVAVGGVHFTVVIHLHAVLCRRGITGGGVGGDREIRAVLSTIGVVNRH